MARPRTPTNVLRLRGAYKKDPQREKEREFEPLCTEPLGDCPENLGSLVAEAWNYLARYSPPGVLTAADRSSFELAAVLWAAHRAGQIDDKGRAQLITLLGKFGMNPADRSKVQAPKQKTTNRFSDIA